MIFNSEFKKQLNQQKGQALLFVVVAMTIALAVGVNVSVRTLSSASRVSSTDTYSRVLAAAEGGAERFIVKTISELATFSSNGHCTGNYGTPANPPSECVVSFPGTIDGDTINARAIITVAPYSTNTTAGDRYEVIIKKDTLVEVSMTGYSASSLQMCWSEYGGGTGSDLYYILYKTDGTLDVKRGVHSNTLGFPYNSNGFVNASSGANGYNYCHTINSYTTGGVKRLRVMAIGNDAKVGFMSSNLPTQGYKIISTGELVEAGNIKATKVVTVYRSLPYLPNVFDASIYTFNALTH